MNVALRKPMSREEFFAWAQRQEKRFEFDGIQPVAMTGGTLRHSQLLGNINRQLGNRLAGHPCRSLGPDAGVATIGDIVRYPDAVVTCGSIRGRELLVPDPVIVFEVVSPSSGRRDRVSKLREYQAVASILRYVIVEPDEIALTVLFRVDGAEMFRAAGLGEGDTLQLPEVGIEIPLADIYQGIASEFQDDEAGA